MAFFISVCTFIFQRKISNDYAAPSEFISLKTSFKVGRNSLERGETSAYFFAEKLGQVQVRHDFRRGSRAFLKRSTMIILLLHTSHSHSHSHSHIFFKYADSHIHTRTYIQHVRTFVMHAHVTHGHRTCDTILSSIRIDRYVYASKFYLYRRVVSESFIPSFDEYFNYPSMFADYYYYY